MSSMETKHEICSPFVPRRRNSFRKTCAEIVSETRQSLRVQSTQRPFTPQDGHRKLFGRNSVRADSDSRPSSTFRSVMHSTVQYTVFIWKLKWFNCVLICLKSLKVIIYWYFAVFMVRILMLQTPGQALGLTSRLWTMYVSSQMHNRGFSQGKRFWAEDICLFLFLLLLVLILYSI